MLRINSLLFLFIINMSYAQYDITWINPVTDGNAINDICFVDETNGWAVGEKGKIVYSNGEDWKNIEPVTNNNLYAISLIDENCGWAVGERGTIIKLENGSWFQYYSGTQADLKDVTFIDREHGWAVGEVIMFCDGLNWTITNENLNLETVYFVDNRNGWAGGFDTILKSNGINWKGVYTPLSPSNYCSINSFWFSDTLLGWAAGWTGADLNSVFLNYKNGSWEISNTWPWPRNAIHSLYFDDVDHGWECGYGGYFNLGGQSIWEYSGGLWTKVKRTNDLPSSMFALNPSLIYAGAKHGNIFKYNGEVWGLCNSMMDGTVDVCFPDVNNGWAIGETDEIWHYQISKWHRDTSFKGYSFTKVHFYNENIGCASAINEEDFEYSLFVYRNGEWNFREKSYDWIKDMCTTSDGSVWVLDPGNYDTCIVYRLYDTEIDTYLFPRVHFNEIDFPGLSHGWAVGWERINTIKRGVIYKFENGIWNLEQLFNDEIEMISMCDTGYGWAVGGVARDHVIYEYDNREWTLFSDIRYYITDIDCLDREHSYMTTWGGDMLSYNGSEWTLSSIVRDRWLNSVSFPEPGKGWIGGNYGGIFEVKYDGFVEVTELNNPTVDFDITIFPNPAYDNINIRVTGPEDCKISGEIISLTGCVVLPIPVNNFAHNDRLIKLNIESLKMGIYILNIKTDQQVCSKKIIVL